MYPNWAVPRSISLSERIASASLQQPEGGTKCIKIVVEARGVGSPALWILCSILVSTSAGRDGDSWQSVACLTASSQWHDSKLSVA